MISALKNTQITEEEIDDLLSKLTPEEIVELNNDVDPDNSLLPPSQRCRYHSDKQPTGPFDRDRLLKFLEEKAKLEKDWERNKPFIHETRGKVFVKKSLDEDKTRLEMEAMGFEAEIEDDIEEALRSANEEQLVDLAAALGFTAMLTQEQVHASLQNKDQMYGGFSSVTKSQKLREYPVEPPNIVNVEEIIQKLQANDCELKELKLNNVKDISRALFKQLCEALHKNTVLVKLCCANTALTNSYVEPLEEMLKVNCTLKSLNLESNYLTGKGILKIMEAVGREESAIEELFFCNQRQAILGVKTEVELTRLVLANPRLLKFGIDVDTADARVRIADHISHNIDAILRQKRRN